MPRRTGLGPRRVQFGTQQGGEAGTAQRLGIGQREVVLGPEVVGEGEEVVPGLPVATGRLRGGQGSVGPVGVAVQIPPPETTGKGEG